MEQFLYERPREKLIARGASALSTAELLQVLIGSGTKKFPVARLAKVVNKRIVESGSHITYTELLSVQGLGVATACRIVAALQLGARYQDRSHIASFDVSLLESCRSKSLVWVSLDGASVPIKQHRITVNPSDATPLIAKRIVTRALADGAFSIMVAVGYAHQPAEPSTFDLSILHDLNQVTGLLQIRLVRFELVGRGVRVEVG